MVSVNLGIYFNIIFTCTMFCDDKYPVFKHFYKGQQFPEEFTKLLVMRAGVSTWSTCQRNCVPAWFTYYSACLRANVPKRVSIFQTFLLQDAKGNFYSLLLYKKLYILLDIIVIHIICISIVHKSCIILHFYTSCHIKENCVEFFFYYFFSFLLFS